jgi:hypothetical protein
VSREPKQDMDERVHLPLDPEAALRALLAIEPEIDESEDKPSSPE